MALIPLKTPLSHLSVTRCGNCSIGLNLLLLLNFLTYHNPIHIAPFLFRAGIINNFLFGIYQPNDEKGLRDGWFRALLRAPQRVK